MIGDYYWPYGRTVKHEHKHDVKHSFNGSIAVDPNRAVSAFKRGLEAIDYLVEHLRDEILEAEQKSKDFAAAEEKKSFEKRERKELAKAKVAELEAKRHCIWGLSKEDSDELKKEKDIADAYCTSYHYDIWMRWATAPTISSEIAKLRREMQQQLALCSVSIDCAHLSPEWAAQVFHLEKDAVEFTKSKYPFSQLAKGAK